MGSKADFARMNLEIASDLIARKYAIRDEYLLGQPMYLDALNYLVDVIEAVLPAKARVLEVSCGTGILAELILSRLPQVRLDVSEISRETLELVRRRTRRFGERIRFLKKDNAAYSFTGSYDAIVTTHAMRLTFIDYLRLYRCFHGILKGSGLVLIAEADVRRHNRRESFLAAIGDHLNDMKTTPGSSKRWDAFRKSRAFTHQVDRDDIMRVVRFYSPAFHLARLRAGGFDEAEVIYKKYQTVIIAAMKGRLSFAKGPE